MQPGLFLTLDDGGGWRSENHLRWLEQNFA
jgi:hypothetical protein